MVGVIVALLGGAALVLVVGPAAAGPVPEIHPSDVALARAASTTLLGSGLGGSTGYVLTADYGSIDSAGTSVAVTSAPDGTLTAGFEMTTDVPAQVSSVTITLAGPGDNVVASTSIAVTAPQLRGGACPGRPIGFPDVWDFRTGYLTGALGSGFPDGSYTLSSAAVRFAEPVVQAVAGAFTATGRAVTRLPATFTVTATSVADPGTSWTWIWSRGRARATASARTPWTLVVKGSCFAPGETVRVRVRDGLTTAPAEVVAKPAGGVLVVAAVHPVTGPSRSRGVSLTGLSSRQTATTAGTPLRGTTLGPDQVLTSLTRGTLVSDGYGYLLRENWCHPIVQRYGADGSGSTIWRAPVTRRGWSNCRLVMHAGGNLALVSGKGVVIWATHTTGTTFGNYLRVETRGVAAVHTATNATIWTSAAGRTPPPRHAILHAGAALRRGQHIDYGNTRLELLDNGNLVATRADLIVWASHSGGRGGVRVVLRPDGNLVVQDRTGRIVWASRTRGSGTHNRVVVLATGDVAMYTAGGRLVWHTGTGL
jgi:hypothetical protein